MSVKALAWLLLFVLFTKTREARGQEGVQEGKAPGGMTLEQAIAFGRAHQPQALAARARIGAARQEAAVPGAQWRPFVGAFGEIVGATMNNSTAGVINQPTVDLARIGATPLRSRPDWVPYPTSLVAIGVRQTILDFGRIQAQVEAAKGPVRIEEARAEAAELDVEWQIALAFYDVLAARASVGVAGRALARAKGRRDFIEAAAGAGMRATTDRTRAEADVARSEAALARAEGGVRMARMRLSAAMGAAVAEVDAIDPPPPRPAPLPREAELAALIDARDPGLRAAREAVHAQEALTRAVAASGRPHLFATGALSARGGGATPSAGGATPGGGFLPLVPNFDVGLILNVPLYDPSIGARAEASRAREAALRHELEAARQRQVAFARQIHGASQIADDALPSLERSARAAAVNAEQAEARFKAGLGTVNEVAEAEALRVEAELLVVLGKFDARRARAALKRALSDREVAW